MKLRLNSQTRALESTPKYYSISALGPADLWEYSKVGIRVPILQRLNNITPIINLATQKLHHMTGNDPQVRQIDATNIIHIVQVEKEPLCDDPDVDSKIVEIPNSGCNNLFWKTQGYHILCWPGAIAIILTGSLEQRFPQKFLCYVVFSQMKMVPSSHSP